MDSNSMNVTSQQEQQPVQEPMQQVEQRSKRKPVKGILCAVLTLIAFLAIQMIVSGVGAGIYMFMCIANAGGDVEAGTQNYMALITESGFMTNLLAITTVICAAVALIWYRFGIVKKYTAQQKQEFRSRINGRNVALVIFAGIGCYGIALLLAEIIAVIIPGSMETYNELMGSALSGNAIVSLLTVVILAPIGEELIFRGIIFRMLEKNLPLAAAIILQAVMFGIYHMNIMQGIYVIPLALVLGYTAYRSKSVYPCILMHLVNNLMPTLLGVLPENTPVIPVAIVIIIASAVVLYPLSKEMRKCA